MNNINMANRQCCDLDIRDFKTKAPWMFAEFCNTTTMGFSSEPVYAMKKGAKLIKFDNPLDGTISMTFQVHPFKVYSMLSDGEIESTAVISRKELVEATTEGSLTLAFTPKAGTLFVYPEGAFGEVEIEGTVANGKFTAATVTEIAVGASYEVAYIEEKTSGVQRVSFNNKKVPKYFYVQMSTLDKNEDGELVPVRITAHKAAPQRNLELSFSSAGDPAEITITFDALENQDGDILDMIEITDETK